MRHSKFRSALCAGAVAGLMVGGAAAAEEKPAEIIAAHIRQQGYACENALSGRGRRAGQAAEIELTGSRGCNGNARAAQVALALRAATRPSIWRISALPMGGSVSTPSDSVSRASMM